MTRLSKLLLAIKYIIAKLNLLPHKLSNIKLRFQLYFLIFVFLITVTIIQLFYFFSFNQLTTKKADDFITSITSQIENQIIDYDQEIQKITNFISFNDTVQDYIIENNQTKRYTLSSGIYSILDTEIWVNDYIENIQIYDNQKQSVMANTNDLFIIRRKILKDYKIESTEYKKGFFTKAYYNEDTSNFYIAYINPIFNKFVYHNSTIGKTILIMNTGFFQTIIDNIKVSQDVLIYICDLDGIIIAANNTEIIGISSYNLHENISSLTPQQKNMIKHLDKSTNINKSIIFDNFHMEMKLYIPKSALTNEMLPIVNQGILITLVFIIIVSIIGMIIISNIVRPISKITSQLEHVGEGTIKHRLNIKSNNEISIIVDDINIMLERIENMTRKVFDTQDKLYTLELSKKQAELSALQSQINPHFLYNTLECIRSIGIYYEVDEIHHIASSMANIFRYAIKQEDIVTLQDEIDCIHDYMLIMNIRFMDKFELYLNIVPELLNTKINKMILQPIIENAVYHGLEHKLGEGEITISATYNEGDDILSLTITDNGKGIPKDNLIRLQQQLKQNTNAMVNPNYKRSIGLLNINNRLKLTYGDRYGIYIDSHIDEGTTITLNIPKLN